MGLSDLYGFHIKNLPKMWKKYIKKKAGSYKMYNFKFELDNFHNKIRRSRNKV